MAGSDYYCCDVCYSKAFYDANIDDTRYTSQFVKSLENGYGTIKMKALCPRCAPTHEISIIEKAKAKEGE